MRFSLTIRFLLLPILVGAYFSQGRSDDWPQWRGIDRNNRSNEQELLKSWPEAGPKLKWIFEDCGVGYAGPAIVGNRLFTIGARENKELLICIDVSDGTEIWHAVVGERFQNDWGDGPRSTPTFDDGHIYALGAKGDLVCVIAGTGDEKWRINLRDFGGRVPNWGYSESVLVDGDNVICSPGGEKGTILALEKQTGQRVWQSEDFTDSAHYASIVAADHNGTRQYIQVTERSVVGIDSASGKLVWHADWPGQVAVVPTPIFHEGHAYVTSGYGAGCNRFKLESEDTVSETYDDKAQKVMKNHHGGVVLHDGHVFGYSDGVGWVCQQFVSGKRIWRSHELGKGALTFADGMLFLISESSGEVVLIEASTEGWKEHGRFTLAPQTKRRKPRGRIWVHPVIANGHMYLRDQDLLYCYDIKQPDDANETSAILESQETQASGS